MLKSRPHLASLRLANFSIPQKLGLIIAIFVAVLCVLLLVSNFVISVSSDVRAYVGGEGLWSKAQKDAVNSLTRYTIFRQPEDRKRYLNYIQVPLGDSKARHELESPKTNFRNAEMAFIQGRNHPSDVRGMILLFKDFNFISFIRDAAIIWQKADIVMKELIDLGEEIHLTVISGAMTEEKTTNYLRRINEINDALTPLEDQFSYRLGEGARWLKQVAFWLMVASAGWLLLLAVLIAIAIARHMVQEIKQLRDAAAKIAQGDFNQNIEVRSKDEIGDLAMSFRHMAMQRQQAEQLLSQRARELDEMNQKLIETERLKDNFLATVSHELRTPLTLVLAPLEALLAGDYAGLSAQQRPILEIMHNNTIRLLQMVTGLLDFSKLEAGRMEIKREPLEIHTVSESILNDFRPLMNQKRIMQQIEMIPDKLTVFMDRYLFERIFFNLLSNAVKFTPEGGKISVSITWKNNRLWLSVTDTGIGIPQEKMPLLFEKFRQLEGASTRRFEGTGLGLTLVKEFAELLGGKVLVESQVGKGSTFTVELEATASNEVVISQEHQSKRIRFARQFKAEDSMPQPVLTSSASLPKLLIAEDNDELASFIASQLTSFVEIRHARDGESALKMTRQWHPDIVLSDVMMPGMDGFTLCKAIKSELQTANIPVVLLTALTHREALLKGWEAGADEYLFKPFHPKELVTRIQSIIKNIHRLHELNQELIQKAEMIARIKTELDQLELFAFITSHDLQEPLRSIAMFSDLVKTKMDPLADEKTKMYFQRMNNSVRRLGACMDRLTDFAKIVTSGNPLRSVALNWILKEVISECDSQLKEVQGEIYVAELPVVFGDPFQIHQLFRHLVSNAIKFRKKDKRLIISVQSESMDPKYAKITFEDNGIGFDNQFAEKIFKPFQRLHRQEEIEGTGMGLAICQKIVLRHGGQITAHGQLGKGCVFEIELLLPENDASKAVAKKDHAV